MSNNATSYTAADLRKALIKRASKNISGAVPESLSAPTQRSLRNLVDFVMYYDSSCEDLPDDIEDAWMYQVLLTQLESHLAWESVRKGDVSSMRGIAGSQYDSNSVDAGQLEWVEFVRDLFKPDDRHHMLNLAITAPPPPEGPTGVGKSFTGYSLLETLDYIADIHYCTNNTTDPFDTRTTWTGLVEWLENTDGQKVFMWDEAAQTLMYDDQVSGKELAKLIRLLRKYNCHLILIGHTGMGIPKDTRRMLSFLQKQSQKSAVYGVGLEESKNGWMELTDELNTIENIPPTKIEYNDIDDKGLFEFDLGDSEASVDTQEDGVDTSKEEDVIDYLSSEDGLRTVADRHDTTHETLRNWVQEFTEENEAVK